MSLAILVAASLTLQVPTIEDVCESGLKSVTFSAVVGTSKQSELRKINSDFARSYRFKRTDVWLKVPFMIRLESKVDDSDILMIINGTKRKLRIPRAGLSRTFDLKDEPGQRQTALDFGLITPALFKSFFVGTYVRTDRRTGEYVFDITYNPKYNYRARNRVWIDPEKKIVAKRQWYAHKDGHLLATFEYLDPIQQGGVWFSTKVTVKNADNKVAGTTTYSNVKLNIDIDDKLFDVG
ncbi:MAG: outer membrane lipoprotein-sorting protein [Armatimonadetes bacterium]|nr:outer membrane lipoprotein-sorting protein [Armatimonadota bacterium]